MGKLSRKREPVLGQEIEYFDKDDLEGRNRFVEKNLPLVISIAKRNLRRGLDYEDLVQEGIVGLITAAKKFDPSRGFRFSTYATWWIRQAIEDAVLRYGDTIKKPSNFSSHLKSLIKATQALQRTLGRKPSVEEIAREAEMDINMVTQLLSLIPGTISLDTPISDDQDSSKYMDIIEDRSNIRPDDVSIGAMMRDDIDNALGELLTEKENRVIRLRFGLDSGETRSLREVGKIFDLSPERIRQIEERAISKLRASGPRKILREYLN